MRVYISGSRKDVLVHHTGKKRDEGARVTVYNDKEHMVVVRVIYIGGSWVHRYITGKRHDEGARELVKCDYNWKTTSVKSPTGGVT